MHAFQQPYDASVSEIDPMDLATPEQDQGKSIGRLTRLMARSLSIVWQSARTPFLALDWAEATQRPFPNAAGLCSAAGFDGRAGHLGEHWRSLASGAASHAAGGPDRRHCGYRLRAGRARALCRRGSAGFRSRAQLRYAFEHLGCRLPRDLAQHLWHRSRLGAAGSLGSAVLLPLTLFLLGWLISTGRLSIVAAGAALVAIRLLASQIQSGLSGVQAIFESGQFIDDLDGFLTLAPAAEGGSRAIAPPPDFRRVRADAVSFSYPGRSALALQSASIEINQGEVVAPVGENGSGKTTLAKVIAGLYEPGSGAVRWDGVDVRTFRPELFRERVAIIFQDFVRYALSAEENIAVARPDDEIDHAAIREAARIADADSFLSILPAGYQTPLSRRFVGGHELSGGQWQKVAIARAFYRNAPLVIIDEPTAALDARAEYELFSSLHEVLRGRSALIISHRFSTVRTADRIYVLDHGRVVEQGSHDELVALRGQYAELFHLQASAYSVDSVLD